jgi:methylated-DNA-protein-cysteine methyltransferase-like protein
VPSPTYSRIYAVVRRIPKGKVASYGQVARLAKIPHGARQVGYALHAAGNARALPWHRVLNVQGQISLGGDSAITQRLRLEAEGVRFNAAGRVDLKVFGWKGRVGA